MCVLVKFGKQAGLGKCGARLEAILRGPAQWCEQKFLGMASVITLKIMSDVKQRGPKRLIPT